MVFEEDFYIQNESYDFNYSIKNQGLENANGSVLINIESPIFENEQISLRAILN